MKGHIVERAKGSFAIVLDLGKDPKTGKRKQKWITVHGTKKQAQQELNRKLGEIQDNTFVEPSKLSVGEFLDQWLKNYAEIHVGGKTLERYQSIIAQHLKPAFGQMLLTQLRPLHLQAHYATALKTGRKDGREGGLSPQSVLHHHRLIHKVLDSAVKWQMLKVNPADATEPPSVEDPDIEALDETECAKLIEAAQGTRLFMPILLAVCAGLRRGEILACRWSDVDWFANTLMIRRAVEQTKAGITMKQPKSKHGRRTIALQPLMIEALKDHRAAQGSFREALASDYRDDDLICCVEDGSLWKPSAFTSAYRDLLRRRGLTRPNFHALRHSHASQLLKSGIDIKLVSTRLGHSKASFTYDRYVHLLPGQDEEAARRHDASLRVALDRERNAKKTAQEKSVSKALAKQGFKDSRSVSEFVS